MEQTKKRKGAPSTHKTTKKKGTPKHTKEDKEKKQKKNDKSDSVEHEEIPVYESKAPTEKTKEIPIKDVNILEKYPRLKRTLDTSTDFREMAHNLTMRMYGFMNYQFGSISKEFFKEKAKSVTYGIQLKSKYGDDLFNDWVDYFYEDNKQFMT